MALDPALRALGAALGHDRVVVDLGVREAHACDESETAPVVPEAVVRARTTDEVATVLRLASAHQLPVTPRAAGTGRVGGAVPVPGGIILSLEQMAALKDLDRTNGTATVEPGLVTGSLHAAAEAEGWFYPPDPNSSGSCTLGGNIATNAGGPRALKYGVTRNYVLGLRAVTGDGTVLELGRRTRKGVTGYDLTSLVVGSEGTLAVVTEATIGLVPNPEAVVTLLCFLAHEEHLERALGALYGARLTPRCAEFLDAATLALLRGEAGVGIPDGARALLLVEFDGPLMAMEETLERAGNVLTDAGASGILVAQRAGERERLWGARREMSRMLRRTAKQKLSEDVVVPRHQLPALVRAAREIGEAHAVRTPSYGHAGDGNLHVNFLWDDAEDWPTVRQAIAALFGRVMALGGTLSGEHGIGVQKAPFLPLEQSVELMALEERVKALFDPKGVLNPGKIFPAAARQHHGVC